MLFDERELQLTGAVTEQLVRASELFLDQNGKLAYTRIAVVLGSQEALQVAERFRSAVNSQTKAIVEAFLDKKRALA